MLLPYDMFELERSAEEAKRFDRMRNIYHRGQSLSWNGTEVLDDLVAKHGGVKIAPHLVAPLAAVFGPVLWGELAAWKVAAQLADQLEPLEAKMAATSQAHDEARHFYVLHDYLKLATGGIPTAISRSGEKLLASVMTTKNLAKKIVGMQLQVESTALTLFHATREARFCPVLSDLLLYFEKDEARHVGLGTQYLPTMLRRMSRREIASFALYQLRVVVWQLASVKAAERDLIALGLDPRRLLTLGQSKQALIYDQIWSASPGSQSTVGESGGRILDMISEILWPKATTERTARGRITAALATLRNGSPLIPTHLSPP